MRLFRNFLSTTMPAFVMILMIGCAKEKPKEKRVRENVNTVAEMKNLVKDISAYCKQADSTFIVVPQNAGQLSFNDLTPESGIDQSYLDAVDGFGVESLFYNSTYEPDTVRLKNLRELRKYKPILVSEYIADEKNVWDAKKKVAAEKFVCFPRIEKNINYEYIPKIINYSTGRSITKLRDINNYLYLINPVQYKEKTDFLDAVAKTNFDMIIMDLFFNNNEPFTSDEIAQLKKKPNGAERLVICYLNVGSAENWRYYWKKNWKLHSPEFIEKKYEGYENEFWVKYWDKNWRKIIFGNDASYAKKIINAGFDGVYLDNVEAYHYIYSK